MEKKKTRQKKSPAKTYTEIKVNEDIEKTKSFISTVKFAHVYMLLALLILLATTIFWSTLSARLQLNNSDQIVNPYLFENSKTFHGTTYSGAHTFLIKWPLFLVIKMLGATSAVLVDFTVGLVLATVGILTLIIYKIERRPLVFGTICLALASVLMLVPAQPYAGGLLPVNMAMITTRNIEYIIFILSLALLVKNVRIRSLSFWIAVLALSLLIASDKLFLTLGLGGALIALVFYCLVQKWTLVSLNVRWLVAGGLSALGSLLILWFLGNDGVTHILGQSAAGPYGLAQGPKGIVMGGAYALLGLFTNFGANPAFGTTLLRQVPHDLISQLSSLSIIAFAINGVLLILGIYMIYVIIKLSFRNTKSTLSSEARSVKLSLMLIATTLIAFAAFIFSNHYFVADARYLSITVFTVFIAAATYTSKKQISNQVLVATGLVIIVGILTGIASVNHTYKTYSAALSTNHNRDQSISEILQQKHVSTLVGDYWRVMPAKLDSNGQINVTPLSGCTVEQTVLSSTTWKPDLNKNSFAYLLSLDGNLTNYPDDCTLQQVINGYGRPNSSTLVAGTLKQPKELLLFYDHGINKPDPKTAPKTTVPATVVPITLDELPYTNCSGPSVMNIVAHQDDDLLFTNPDLLHDIKAGHCVRSIYLTSGDAGGDKYYWLSRERGSEAAYSYMLGTNDVWIQRIVKLSDNEYITVANPKSNSKVSLIFMHLPDGNVNGQGFKLYNNQSLEKLESGQINAINSVDQQSYYTDKTLANALTALMQTYQPTIIRTQATKNLSAQYPDHSDHIATGKITQAAYNQYELQQFGNELTVPIEYFIGYPIHGMPENVSGTDLTEKENAFMVYAKHDAGVCQPISTCFNGSAYGFYLKRQYQQVQ